MAARKKVRENRHWKIELSITLRRGIVNGPVTALSLEVFTQRNSVVEFIRFIFICIHKNDKFTF